MLRKGLTAFFWAMALVATPAAAQFSDSYYFLKAVRDRDGTKATKYLSEPGTVIVDTRDITTGETGLHIVVKGRDLQWINFLLARGAKTEVKDRDGNTPLLIAARMRFLEGVSALLKSKAAVDGTNSRGETALIAATQLRDAGMVRLLLDNGANPDKRDTLSGQSARDYAKNDPRAAAILKIIEEPRAKPKAASMGPKL